MMEITPEEYRKKNERNEDSLRDLCDNIKRILMLQKHLHYWGPRRRRERERT